MSNPVQYIRHFRDKMVFYSRNDPLMYLTFSSSLKGVASNWFYSLSGHLLLNFEEITESFLNQYASHREAKKNNHHLLIVKIRPSDSLKSYISYFQNQLTKAANCGEDISALTFFNRLQVSHPLYKHLLKHDSLG